jgi:hypothetical protein
LNRRTPTEAYDRLEIWRCAGRRPAIQQLEKLRHDLPARWLAEGSAGQAGIEDNTKLDA